MKNKITLLRSYTFMLMTDLLSWGAFGEDWSKLRSVSRQVQNHMKCVYQNKGDKAKNLAENERLITMLKKQLPINKN